MQSKIFAFLHLFVLIIASFCLCACKNETSSSSKKEILRLVTSADNPPFEFHQTTTNKITGFDIELAYALADELNVEITVQDMDFSSLIPALLSGRADFAIATFSITPERSKAVDFSNIYYTAQPASISLKRDIYSLPQHFSGKNIGVQLGSSYEYMMKKIAREVTNIKLISLNKIGEIIQEIKSGRLDGAVIDIAPAKAYVQNNSELHANLIQGYQESYAIAFRKNSVWTEKFNHALKKLKDNGKLEQLKSKWFMNKAS